MSYEYKTGMRLESLEGAGSLVWKRMMPAPFVLEKRWGYQRLKFVEYS